MIKINRGVYSSESFIGKIIEMYSNKYRKTKWMPKIKLRYPAAHLIQKRTSS